METYRVLCSGSTYGLDELDADDKPIWTYDQHEYLQAIRLEYPSYYRKGGSQE